MARVEDITLKEGDAFKEGYISVTVGFRLMFTPDEFGREFHLAIALCAKENGASALSILGRIEPLYTFTFGRGPLPRDRYTTIIAQPEPRPMKWTQAVPLAALCVEEGDEMNKSPWGVIEHEQQVYALVTLAQEARSPVETMAHLHITSADWPNAGPESSIS